MAQRLVAGVSFIDREGSLLYFRAYPLSQPASNAASPLACASGFGDHDPAALELAVFASLDYINDKLVGSLAACSPLGRPIVVSRPGASLPAAPGDLYVGLLVRTRCARERVCGVTARLSLNGWCKCVGPYKADAHALMHKHICTHTRCSTLWAT